MDEYEVFMDQLNDDLMTHFLTDHPPPSQADKGELFQKCVPPNQAHKNYISSSSYSTSSSQSCSPPASLRRCPSALGLESESNKPELLLPVVGMGEKMVSEKSDHLGIEVEKYQTPDQD